MNRRHFVMLALLVVTLGLGFVFPERAGIAFAVIECRLIKKAIAGKLAQFGTDARNRLQNDFSRARVSYPPNRLTLKDAPISAGTS